jgi:hypothetical protein
LMDGADGGPGDEMEVSYSRRDVRLITHAADSLPALEQWLNAQGIGLLQLSQPRAWRTCHEQRPETGYQSREGDREND